MWVKICANTNLEDAAAAVELGADAVGFVFAKSKRQVTGAQVAAITAALPGEIERIGVFDSNRAEEIAPVASEAGLSGVQLHGGYDEALITRLSAILPQLQLIPVLHWSVGDEGAAEQVSVKLREIASSGLVRKVLIDSKVNGATGGTGISFDWRAARRAISEEATQVDVILAGGLNPENITQAIHEVKPFGVDVASGVERSAGRKDPGRIAEFIRKARAAEGG